MGGEWAWRRKAAAGLQEVLQAGEQSPPMVSKITDIRLKAGQRVRLETPGGGGWGEPAARDPEAAGRDLRLGYVSKGVVA